MWHAAPGQHNVKPFALATTRIEYYCRQLTSSGSSVTHAACSEDGSVVACVHEDGVLTACSNNGADVMVVSMLSECPPHKQMDRCTETAPINVQIVETDEASSALIVHFQNGDLFQWLPDDKVDGPKRTWRTCAYRTTLHSSAISWSQSRTMVAALSQDREQVHLMAVGASNEDESNETEQPPVSLLPICDVLEAHPSSSGSEALQTVGWGNRATQFQGMAGKQAREKEVHRTLEPKENQAYATIAWHKDEKFAVNVTNPADGYRYIRVYDRFGQHLSTLDPVEYLQWSLCWKHTAEATFFAITYNVENGQAQLMRAETCGKVRELTLLPQRPVECLPIAPFVLWNDVGDVLAIVWSSEHGSNGELYTISRAKLYCEQRVVFDSRVVHADFVVPHQLILVHANGTVHQMHVAYKLRQSERPDELRTIAYSDADTLYISPMALAVTPPPVASYTVRLQTTCVINDIILLPTRRALLLTTDKKATLILAHFDNDVSLRAISMPQQLSMALSSGRLLLRRILAINAEKCVAHFVDVEIRKGDASVQQNNFVLEIDLQQATVTNAKRFTATPNNRRPITLITVNSSTEPTLDTINTSVNDICTDRIEFSEECATNLYASGALIFNGLLVHSTATSLQYDSTFLVFTAHSVQQACDRLYTVPLDIVRQWVPDNRVDETQLLPYSVLVDTHSLIVSVHKDCVTLLTTVRGDYTTLHPRAMLRHECEQLMQQGDYITAAECMLRHRLQLHHLLNANVERFTQQLEHFARNANARLIEMLVQDLQLLFVCMRSMQLQVHCSMWKLDDNNERHLRDAAVDSVMRLRAILEKRLTSDASVCRALICAYIMINSGEPDVDGAMMTIKTSLCEQTEINASQLQTTVDHLVGICPSQQRQSLYDHALLTRNRELITVVATQLQLDPQEYEPQIDEFLALDEQHAAFRINMRLRRYAKAAQALGQLPYTDKLRTEYDKALTRASADRTPAGVVVSRDIQRIVYDDAMQALMENTTADKRWLQTTAAHYAQWQKTRGSNFIAAANLYAIAGEVAQALQLYEQQGDWHGVLSVVESYSKNQDRKTFAQCYSLNEDAEEQATTILRRMLSKRETLTRGRPDDSFELAVYLKEYDIALNIALDAYLWRQAKQLCITMPSKHDYCKQLGAALLERCTQLQVQCSNIVTTVDGYIARLKVVRDEQLERIKDLYEQGGRLDNVELFSEAASTAPSSIGASTAALSTSTKRERRKKQKAQNKRLELKEGSRWEQLALLNAVHAQYDTLRQAVDEFNTLSECLPLLYNEADVVLAARRLSNELEMCRRALYGDRLSQIWPEKWTCECLPAPLEVLYADEDGQLTPPRNDNCMPDSFELYEQMQRPRPVAEMKSSLA